MPKGHSWSSKLVYQDVGHFFIRSIKLNPFDCWLHVIVIHDSKVSWYDYVKTIKNVDLWEKFIEHHDEDFVKELEEGEKKLIMDFLNREKNSAGGACMDNGGLCLFPTHLNHCFMMIREDRGIKNAFSTLVHEIFHVVQRLALRYNTDIGSIDTSEVFAYMSDMIFEEVYDNIVETYNERLNYG